MKKHIVVVIEMGRETDPARILSWISSKSMYIECVDTECMVTEKITSKEDVEMILSDIDALFNEIWIQSKGRLEEDTVETVWNAIKEALQEATDKLELKRYIADRIEDIKWQYL